MNRYTRLPAAALAALGAGLLAACAGYYKVTDLQNGGTYYTRDVDDEGKAGAIRFKDARTGSVVTLPTSEVRRISEDRYEEGLKERK